MRYIQIILIFGLFSLTNPLISQSNIEDIVKEGVQYHDKGNFEKAIEIYKKALKLNPNSPLANYEISLSYFSKGNYKKAIKYSNKVLKTNSEYKIQAYMTKGSALDLQGKTKESIKLFKEAINNTSGHYLLNYNLALNYFKINNLDDAEKNAIGAIKKNPNHASSHLLLGTVHNLKSNPVQSLLALHYFLFLEPNTKRSIDALKLIHSNMEGNVSKDEKNSNNINILLSVEDDNQFSSAELMISMLEASRYSDENKDKTDEEMFTENTKSFFLILGEGNIKENESSENLWNSFYIPFYNKVANSDHFETYCKYITQSENKNYRVWLKANKEKINNFDKWLRNN